jgi:hypothetical protein
MDTESYSINAALYLLLKRELHWSPNDRFLLCNRTDYDTGQYSTGFTLIQ